jgi:hypothetical protein
VLHAGFLHGLFFDYSGRNVCESMNKVTLHISGNNIFPEMLVYAFNRTHTRMLSLQYYMTREDYAFAGLDLATGQATYYTIIRDICVGKLICLGTVL